MNQIKPKRDLQQWEIVLLEFPFTNLRQKKLRPVLIVSNDVLNKTSNSVVTVQITSNLSSGFREYNVLLSDSDVNRYAGTQPMYPSLVKPYVIFTIEKQLVKKRIGLLKPHKIKEVKESLKKVFQSPDNLSTH
ncbi:type II toxin-antitoxin system PemK/MazF family toxin [Thermococcus sp.]